jgi:methylenetetrahydrofolate dehydrogenase (NADP+)/methenyltetrahydrofolate cyclohydrolase
MPCQIIDGKKIAQDIKDEIRAEALKLSARGIRPKLAVVLVGDDPASQIYVRDKRKACEATGIESAFHGLPQNTPQDELLALIAKLNADQTVSGILVQLPLPPHIDPDAVLLSIDPSKDVDCFNPVNVGLLAIGRPSFLPCTPAGIIELMKRTNLEISGKNCVVIGRSNIVGKPAASLFLAENATVTVCHSKTRSIKEICLAADILVVAMRSPKFVTADMVGQGAVVIDVGIHREEGTKKLCGDVDFDSVSGKAAYMTPVPGGVGPMTIAMLMQNCLKAAKMAQN